MRPAPCLPPPAVLRLSAAHQGLTGGVARMPRDMKSDIEIAQEARLRPIEEVARDGRDPSRRLHPLRPGQGQDLAHRHRPRRGAARGAARPGFGDHARRRPERASRRRPWASGRRSTASARARSSPCASLPSGPCFGVKGGAAGGGYSQVVPMEDINLHFTGDFPAITAAHNLLAAMIDNHLHHGNALGIDQRDIPFRRVLDMNDRALRDVVIGLGGKINGVPRETGFDITVASEVMAILCLARDLRRSEGAVRRDRRRLHARRRAGARPRPEGQRRDGGAPEGRDPSQPRPDARGHPRPRPRRPVRQHRARLQLDPRDADRDALRRDRRDRGGIRVRSRRREVPRHQVRLRGHVALGRRPGRDGARAQDARRRAEGRSRRRRPRGALPGHAQPRAAPRQRPDLRAARGRRDQPVPDGLRGRDRVPREALLRARRQSRPLGSLHARRRRGRGPRPRRPLRDRRRGLGRATGRCIPGTGRWPRRSRSSRGASMAPEASRSRKRPSSGSRGTKSTDSATCPSTSPKRRTLFRTTRRKAADPPASRSTWTRRASSRARASSWPSAATS